MKNLGLVRYGVLGGVAVASFAIGRISSPRPTEVDEKAEARYSVNSSRSERRRSRSNEGPGAGEDAVRTAEEIRAIFRNAVCNDTLGSAMAEQQLSRMNTEEITALAYDLARAQREAPEYSYALEINATFQRWGELDPEGALAFLRTNKQSSFTSAAINSLFLGMTSVDPNLALRKLDAIEDLRLKSVLNDCVMTSLAEKHPELFLDESNARGNQLGLFYQIGSIVSEWAMDDPKLASKRAMKLPSYLRKEAVGKVSAIWANKDPRVALSWAISLEEGEVRTNAIVGVAKGMATSDYEGAMKIVSTLEGYAKRDATKAVFRSLAKIDFTGAVAKLRNLPTQRERSLALSGLLSGKSQNGGESVSVAEISELLGATTGGGKDELLRMMAYRTPNLSATEYDQLLGGLSPADRKEFFSNSYYKFCSMPPDDAMELIKDLGDSNLLGFDSYDAIEILSNSAPSAVLKYLSDQEISGPNLRLMSNAIANLKDGVVDEGLKYLDHFPEGYNRTIVIQRIASAWAGRNSEQAIEWANSLEGADAQSAMIEVVESLSSMDARATIPRLSELIESGPSYPSDELKSLITTLGRNLVIQDSAAAIDWLEHLEPGPVYQQAFSSVATQWIKNDFESACRWIDSIPAGEQRDRGVKEVIFELQSSSPEAAFEWAQTISDEDTRLITMKSSLNNLLRRKPHMAQEIIAKAELEPKERERLDQYIQSSIDWR